MTRLVDRVRSDHRVQDALLAAGLFAVFEVEVLTSDYMEGSWILNTVGLAAMTAPIAWRRRAPLLSILLVALAVVAQTALLTPVYKPTTTLALVVVPPYAVAAHAEIRGAVAGLVAYLSAVVGVTVVAQGDAARAVVFNVVIVCAAWLAGRALRNRRQLAHELEAKAARIESEREDRARLAVADERTRIARELHGVVAQSVSAMVVQAEAADRLLDRDPERAEWSMAAIEETGREALTEMRRMLGVLRKEDEGAALAPQPGVAQVHALVERARETGLAVELRVEGEPGPLPAGIDLAAFRVMQDTLEEIVKHASGQTAVATVRYTPDDLELMFDLDDVGDFAPADNVGLLGVRERVALYGGKAWAGPRDAGGYRLYARLPRAFEEVPA